MNVRPHTPERWQGPGTSMKISRNDPLRRRRHPLSMIVWIVPLLVVLLLALSWWKGGEQAVGSIEIPVPADQLGQ